MQKDIKARKEGEGEKGKQTRNSPRHENTEQLMNS